MICVLSSDGHLEFANRTFLEYLGKQPNEVLGHALLQIINVGDDASIAKSWRKHVTTESEFEFSFEGRSSLGSRFMQVHFRPRVDPHTTLTRWYGLVEDVTERRHAEEVLRKGEGELQTLLDSIPALVWRAGPKGEIEYMNKRLGAYVGLSIEEMRMQPWCTLIHPDDMEACAREWAAALQGEYPYDGTFRYRRADGVFRRVRVIGEPYHDATDDVTRWYGLYIDVEQSKALEEALESSQLRLARATQLATIAELSASIAHEVNQPLAAVAANAEACIQWLSSAPPNVLKASAAAQRIRGDGHAAAEVVRRVRGLFKQKAPKITALSIEEVAHEVLRLIRRQGGRSRIELATNFETSLPLVAADKLQMQQVLMNLVTNAIEAMKDLPAGEKRVLITAHHNPPGQVTIKVCDQGSGLKDLTLIFEPFITSKDRGMGIGLALCRSIVQLHSGELWATNNDPAPGATLHFTVPIYSVSSERTSHDTLADQTTES
jgi:PAS domain S-box-containing protein